MRNLPAKYKGRSVLITGGLGFIGSNLARRLAEVDGIKIKIIDSLYPDYGGNLYNIEGINDKVELHLADMADNYTINHLVGGVDYIFNLAGSISHIDSMTMPHSDLQSNCAAQLSLLEACRMFNPTVKIIFTSTRQVYGTPLYLPVDERHRIQPLDINGINKYAAEMYHLLYARAYGLRTVILRLTNTYGERQQLLHNRQGFISWFIRQALNNETIQLFGDGRQRRDLNYVDDVTDAILLAGSSVEAEGEIFNLGHPQNFSLMEIAAEIIRIAGSGSVVGAPFPPDRQNTEIGNCYCSYKKIANVLGWQPKINLIEGLMRTIGYYQRNENYYRSMHEYSVSQSQPIVRQSK
jgi:UDP-glucose 4-epimerase